QSGVPTIALIGSVGAGADEALRAGLSGYELIAAGLPAAESMQRAEELIADAAERVVRRYLRKPIALTRSL
ncbi:MAG: hypothetical protein L0Y45_05615, partial [Woeseiaceae bacterium]|nr:hypothetical protein [Woeseiaceae bacterium]